MQQSGFSGGKEIWDNRAVFPAVRKSEIYISKIITKTHYIA